MEVPLLSIRQAGKYLGYGGKTAGRSTIYELLREKRLVRVKIRSRTFVTRKSADALIAENSEPLRGD